MTLRARALEYFVEPSPAPPPMAPKAAPAEPPRAGFLSPLAVPRSDDRVRPATRLPARAAVLGPAAEAVPLGALLATALRSCVGTPAAALGVWAPGTRSPVRAGPATLAASQLAARLTARGLPAVARGRLGWMALDAHPVAAAVAARRAAGALEVPLVVVLAGPRCDVVEGLLAEQDLVVFACAEPEGPLARLAVAGCAGAALACAAPPPGPSRWLARSGAAGTRGLPPSLRSLVRELAAVPAPEPMEVAW
jgi:hypothetical protein